MNQNKEITTYRQHIFLKLIPGQHMQHFISFLEKKDRRKSFARSLSRTEFYAKNIGKEFCNNNKNQQQRYVESKYLTVVNHIIYTYSLSLCSQTFFIQMNHQRSMPKETNLSTKHLEIVLPRLKCKIRPTTNHKRITQKNV